MKVIAIKKEGDVYLCEVGHTELEKFMGQYYGNMVRLKEGSEIDLGKGYDFYSKTKDAFHKTQEFINSNKETMSAIFDGIKLFR